MATGGCDESKCMSSIIKKDAVPYSDDSMMSSPPASLQAQQSAKFIEDQSEDNYKDYIEFMPTELKYGNFHILLLYSKKDRKDVLRFQRRIQRDCVVIVDGVQRNPIVKLEEEFVTDDPVYGMDQASKKALYVFLFVTKAFCEEYTAVYKGNAFLVDALEGKRWSVIPVQTENKTTRNKERYRLPMMLNALQAISYHDRNFYKEAVQRLLEAKVGVFESMNLYLEDERKLYFEKNKKDLQRMKQTNRLKQSTYLNCAKSSVQQEQDCKPLKSKPVRKNGCESEERMEYSAPGYTDLKSNPNDSSSQNDRVCNSGKGSDDSGAKENCMNSLSSAIEEISFDSNPSQNSSSHGGAFPDGRSGTAAPRFEQEVLHFDYSPSIENSSSPRVHPASLLSNHNSDVLSTAVHAPSSPSYLRDQNLTSGSSNWDQQTVSTGYQYAGSTRPAETQTTSGHGNASSASRQTESGPCVVHHHHHHEHFQIESVKYMAVGENSSIKAVDNTGDSKDSNDESDGLDGLDDIGEETEEANQDTEDNSGFCSQETGLKTPHVSTSGPAKSSSHGTQRESQETPLKTTEERGPPPSYQKAMGLSN